MGKSLPFAFLILNLQSPINTPSNFHFASPPPHKSSLPFSVSVFCSFRRANMGRGSAKPAMAVVLAVVVLTCLIFESQPAQAAIYNVGGPGGWSFNVNSWPKGKSFKAGDVLVFNYDRTQHNVVMVDGSGLAGCTARPGSKTLTSGKDMVTLAKGYNNFICTFPQHCQYGMKISVNAL